MGRLQRKPTNANSSKRTGSDIKIQESFEETDSRLKSLLVIPPNDTNTIDIIQPPEQEVHTTTETNQIIADLTSLAHTLAFLVTLPLLNYAL